MGKNSFRRGFLDGWSSIRGSEPAPSISACSLDPGDKDPYRAGIARGVQEAHAKPRASGTAAPDVWLDRALRSRNDSRYQ